MLFISMFTILFFVRVRSVYQGRVVIDTVMNEMKWKS